MKQEEAKNIIDLLWEYIKDKDAELSKLRAENERLRGELQRSVDVINTFEDTADSVTLLAVAEKVKTMRPKGAE